jgi:hypothetical protein
MTDRPTDRAAHAGRVRQLTEDLTANAVRRWGPDHTKSLTAAIASTAETLALVAAVHLAPDDAEPDLGVPR